MTEFASGLRDGYIEMTLNDQMPLNDRSMELMVSTKPDFFGVAYRECQI